MIKLVVFDFDDTLSLTEKACFNLENRIAQKLGHPPMQRQVHLNTWGMPLFEVIEQRIPGIDVVKFEQLFKKEKSLALERGEFDYISPQNYGVLSELKKQGRQTAVLTSRKAVEAQHLLHPDHTLQKALDYFYYQEKTVYTKPDPRVFDTLLAESKLKKDELLYVGDAPSDAQASIKAGIKFVASLESGIYREKAFSDYEVQAFVTDLSGVLEVLEIV